MPQVLLAVPTNDQSEAGAEHALVALEEQDVGILVGLHKLYHETRATAGIGGLYCLEFWWGNAEYGVIRGFGDTTWVEVPAGTEFARKCSTELDTVKVTDTGVLWSAAHKNGGPGDYFETPELPWEAIMKMSQAGPRGALPAADMSSEEDANGEEDEGDDAS